MEAQFENLRSKLIVSCQALEDEPLHSSFIMGRMAKAAYEGGAAGIRANTVEDILEIRKNVSLPIIGIIKEVYDNSEVYITPTLKEVDALMEIKPEIIAVDATKRIRPDGTYLKEFFELENYGIALWKEFGDDVKEPFEAMMKMLDEPECIEDRWLDDEAKGEKWLLEFQELALTEEYREWIRNYIDKKYEERGLPYPTGADFD